VAAAGSVAHAGAIVSAAVNLHFVMRYGGVRKARRRTGVYHCSGRSGLDRIGHWGPLMGCRFSGQRLRPSGVARGREPDAIALIYYVIAVVEAAAGNSCWS
jgi:hypothetical protein